MAMAKSKANAGSKSDASRQAKAPAGGAIKPLRLAVAGLGLRGVPMTNFIRGECPGAEIVALVDNVPGRAELARDFCDLKVPCFDNVERCLEETQPEALAVYTPDVYHDKAVIPALKRGVNVYCEKPMSTTLAACDRMIAAAKASKAVFYMGHNMRMSPFYETVHDLLAGGEMGELLTLETSEYYHGGRTYFRRWNRLLSISGGLWITKSVHDFDMMCWLAGDEPASVYATGGRKVFQPKPGSAERCGHCGLRWECDDFTTMPSQTSGDARSVKHARFWDQWQQLGAGAGYLPADACLFRSDIETLEYGVAAVRFVGGACAAHTLSVVSSPPISARWLTAQCSKGTVTGDPMANTIRVNFRGDKATRTYDVSEQSRGSHGGADGRAFADFVRACRLGTPPVATWADGRRAVKLGLGAQKSMEKGTVVKLAGD